MQAAWSTRSTVVGGSCAEHAQGGGGLDLHAETNQMGTLCSRPPPLIAMTSQTGVVAMILAGGEGKRLYPLTRDRAKPAVPFGGRYRLIDFVLSNFVNSGIYKLNVLTQYKAASLIQHLARGWQLAPHMGHYVAPVPASMKVGRDWYRGSADAVFQNLDLIANERPAQVCVF